MSGNAHADGVGRSRTGDGQTRGRWSTSDRPGLGVLAVVGTTVGIALAFDGLVIVWAAATLLDHHCGEDVAWLGLVAAGIVASFAAFVAVSVAAWWWWRSRPPTTLRRVALVLLTAIGTSVILAGVAVLWLPDGSCP